MYKENFMKDLFHPSGAFQRLSGEMIARGISEFGGTQALSSVAYRASQAARAIVAEALPEGKEPTQLHQVIISCIILGTVLESVISSYSAATIPITTPIAPVSVDGKES